MTSRFYRYYPLKNINFELIDDDPLNLKHHKSKQERLTYLYKKRFNSPHYVKQLEDIKYTPQIVLKVVSKGVGHQAVNYLMQYISRDLNKFKTDERIELINSLGESFKGKPQINKLSRELSQDFESKQYIKDNQDKFNKIEKRRLELESEKEERDLNKREIIELNEINHEMLSYRANLKLKELNLKAREIESKKSLNKFIDKNLEKRKSGLEKICHHNMPADFTHIILSHGGENINTARAKASVDSFLKSEFSDRGFKYVYGMHNDTNHPHFHVIVFNKNSINKDKPPLHLSKEDLFILRQEFVHHSNEYGLKRVSTLKIDNESEIKRMQRNVDIATDKLTQYQYKLQNATTQNFDSFDFRKKLLSQLEEINTNLIKKEKNSNPSIILHIKQHKMKIREIKKDIINSNNLSFDTTIESVIKSLSIDYKSLSKAIQKNIKKPESKEKEIKNSVKRRKIRNAEKLELNYKNRVNEALIQCESYLKKVKSKEQKRKVLRHIEALNSLARNIKPKDKSRRTGKRKMHLT